MQSAQYSSALSGADVLGNMSAAWAPGTLPYKTAPLSQQDGLFSDYKFNDSSLPADELCFASVSGISQENSTGTSCSPITTTAPAFFYPPIISALRKPRNTTQTISPLQTSFMHQDLHSNSEPAYVTSEPQSSISSFTDPFSSQSPVFSSHSPSFSSQSTNSTQHTHNHSVPALSARPDEDAKPRSPINRPIRRRKSSAKDADPVRALYLEKNRIAASKCRNRQKRQEEKLVEKASIVERLNKDLKCEVELLKESMRHLMGDVGRHTNCSDNRLATYVQRRADRLAVDDVQVPFKMEQDMDCDQGWQSTEEK